jgi:REP element-mobilizing transposase RayT
MQVDRKPGSRALRKGRYSQRGQIYLITTTTEHRIPWFQAFEFAHTMCRCLEDPVCVGRARNHCWVVMPDHVHLLLDLRARSLAAVVGRLKSLSAIRLNREIGHAGRFWQVSFHDHAIRAEENLIDAARYIVRNPLRAGLVTKVGDYPFWNSRWLS